MKKGTLLDTIIEGFLDVAYIWKREMKNVVKDQGVLIFFILVPLAYPLLYGFIYTEEVVREVPVIAVDEDHSALSREFIRKVNATPDVNIIAYSNDMEEAHQGLREHQARGILRIPSGFSLNINNINHWQQAHVDIYCDMSSMFYYKALYQSSTYVSLEMNKDIKIQRNSAITTARDEEINTAPIDYEFVPMFNATSGYDGFLLPAVLILILQQTLVLGVGMAAGTAVEKNKFHSLVPFNKHYHGTMRIVLGKALCYIMIYALASLWILVCVPKFYNLPQIPQPTDLLWFVTAYVFAITFFAMTVSVLVRGREKSIILFAFMSVPLLFISGISWPGIAIPTFWKVVSYLFPSTFGINGFVRMNTLSADLSQVANEYHTLWLQTGIYFIITCLVYRWQIITSKKRVIEEYRELKRKQDKK
ncbi:MAG: ABC transporter permease [Bacteroidaceae bacterium]|nr:ABC transporter permease [Bacteroidaceae bacterium]